MTYSQKTIKLNKEQVKDVKNIAGQVYFPLKGFLRKKDYETVVSKMRLSNGKVWPIPIVLDIKKSKYNEIKNQNNILLTN